LPAHSALQEIAQGRGRAVAVQRRPSSSSLQASRSAPASPQLCFHEQREDGAGGWPLRRAHEQEQQQRWCVHKSSHEEVAEEQWLRRQMGEEVGRDL